MADGSEHEPLNEQDILDAIEVLKQQDVQAVAISFVWSIRNTEHEQRAKELIEQHMPGVFVCCGSEVYPQIKEYTRTSTTLVNAYFISSISVIRREILQASAQAQNSHCYVLYHAVAV